MDAFPICSILFYSNDLLHCRVVMVVCKSSFKTIYKCNGLWWWEIKHTLLLSIFFFFTLEWTIHIGHDPSIAKVFLIAQRNTEEELRIFFLSLFLYYYTKWYTFFRTKQNHCQSISGRLSTIQSFDNFLTEIVIMFIYTYN